MSTIYEQLLVDLSVCTDSPPATRDHGPNSGSNSAIMDKSVFARVLKVVIQCVEEGSALLHTFKMEGDISNTRITIEFHSHTQSSNIPPSSMGGSPGSYGDRRHVHQDTSVMDSTSLGSHCSGSSSAHSDNVSSSDRSQSTNKSHTLLTAPTCPNCGCDQCLCNKSQENTAKREIIPKGSTATMTKDKDSKNLQEQILMSQPQKSETGNGSILKPVPLTKPPVPSVKGHRSGTLLEPIIHDQRRIPTLKEIDEDHLEKGSQFWSYDSNQNTVQRKNQNPLTKSQSVDETDWNSIQPAQTKSDGNKCIPNGNSKPGKSHIPIDANVVLKNKQTAMPPSQSVDTQPSKVDHGSSVQATQLVPHPSLITRLAKMSERDHYDDEGDGSSGEDSFDSEESIEMVTDARQFGCKIKKPCKKRKGIISL